MEATISAVEPLVRSINPSYGLSDEPSPLMRKFNDDGLELSLFASFYLEIGEDGLLHTIIGSISEREKSINNILKSYPIDIPRQLAYAPVRFAVKKLIEKKIQGPVYVVIEECDHFAVCDKHGQRLDWDWSLLADGGAQEQQDEDTEVMTEEQAPPESAYQQRPQIEWLDGILAGGWEGMIRVDDSSYRP